MKGLKEPKSTLKISWSDFSKKGFPFVHSLSLPLAILNVSRCFLFKASKVALAQRRPKLGSLQSDGLALMKDNKENEKFVDATKSKVQSVTDLYCNIEDRIKNRIAQVQTALYRCQGFNEALDDFERWLYDTESRFQALGMLSIKPSVIKKQGSGLKVTWRLINGQRFISVCCIYLTTSH